MFTQKLFDVSSKNKRLASLTVSIMQLIKIKLRNKEIDKNQEKWQDISQNMEINQEFVSTKYRLKRINNFLVDYLISLITKLSINSYCM